MKWVMLGLCCALAGCAGQAMEPEPRIVRVEVAVPVPCKVPPVAAPAWATGSLKKTDDLQTKVRAMLAEIRQRQGHEELLLAGLMACQ